MALIPKRVIVNTGEQYTVQETINSFFLDTGEIIKRKFGSDRGPESFEIKSGEISHCS